METAAEVTLEKVADGFAITAVHLTLKGKVPGADQAKFPWPNFAHGDQVICVYRELHLC